MAKDPRQGWESPAEAEPATPQARHSPLSSRDYQPRNAAVKRGGSPIWPLVLVAVLLGGAGFAAVSWLNRESSPESEAVRVDSAEAEAARAEAAKAAAAAAAKQADDPDGDDRPVAADVPDKPSRPADKAPPKTETVRLEPPASADKAPPPATVEKQPPPAVEKQPPPATTPPPAVAAPVGHGIMEGPMLVKKEPPAALASALAKLAEGESEEALAVVAEHAEAGWPEAQTALGLHLAQGSLVQRDFKKAAELFEKAAAQNDALAQYYLGYAYLSGSGVTADPVTALAWFIVAASRGHAEALTERDRGLASLSDSERAQALNKARNLSADVAAGWSRDPASGVAVWLPSWFRYGSYALRVEVPAEDGYAHGVGKIVLKASRPGDSDRTFEGRFFRGHYYGDKVREEEIHFLETDDFLFRLPESPKEKFAGLDVWLVTGYGVNIAADPCYVATNQTPDLLVTVPDGFPVLEDEAVQGAMREGWRLYQELCAEGYHAELYVLPKSFTRQRTRSRMVSEFQPLIARASFYGKHDEKISVSGFQNHARRAHEKAEAEAKRQRERQAREEKRQRDKAAAQTRGNPDVRGLRLGMTLGEVHALYEDEIAEWQPPWQPNRRLAPFRQFSQSIRLTDGATIEASFTSPVNGSVLYVFVYEQRFRGGVGRSQLTADLKAKYGEPDDLHGGGLYWTYNLDSRKPEEMLGAFLKVTIRSFEAGPGKIDFLRLVINDAGFGRYDEGAAHDAEQEEKQRQYEARKSDKPKF